MSCAGLVPVLRLAERAGLPAVAQQRVRLPASAGSAAATTGVKITSVVAGMVAGAESIDDLAVIRHGALPGLFGGIRAPSTWGTFLRGFTWGNVRQLDAVAAETLPGLSRTAPLFPCYRARSPPRFWMWIPRSTACMGMPNRARTTAPVGSEDGIACWRGSRPRSPLRSSPVPGYVGGRRPQPRSWDHPERISATSMGPPGCQ